MKYDLRKLAQVAAVARAGSFSAAAQELHITQPALSRNIAAVERELGVKIFERGRYGAKLTALGQQLVDDISDLVRRADRLESSLQLYAGGTSGPLYFGVGPMLSSLVLPSLVAEFMPQFPSARIRSVIKSAPDLKSDLLDDRIEVFFSGVEQIGRCRELVHRSLGTVPVAAIVRASHPLLALPRVRQQDMRDFPILGGLSIPQGLYSRGQLACDNYHILREAALVTDGIWLSSPWLVEDDIAAGRLAILPLKHNDFIASTTVCAVHRTDFELSPMAQRLVDYLAAFLVAKAAG